MTRFQLAPADPATGDPRWKLILEPREFDLIESLPNLIRRLLADPSSNKRVIARLFPRAHKNEAEEIEHRRLLGTTLLDQRRELLDSIDLDLGRSVASPPSAKPPGTKPAGAASPGARSRSGRVMTLGTQDVDRWLRFLNDVRLTLATELGIERNLGDQAPPAPDHPDALRHALLDYLGGLEFAMIEGLQRSGGL